MSVTDATSPVHDSNTSLFTRDPARIEIVSKWQIFYYGIAIATLTAIFLGLYLSKQQADFVLVGMVTLLAIIVTMYGRYLLHHGIAQSLRESADLQAIQRLATAVAHTDEAIAITDIKGRFEYVNPAFQVLTGYSREEALGETPSTLLKSGEHTEEFYKDLWTTVTSGRVWSGHTRNKKKNGMIYDEMQTISPIQDANTGKITGFVTVKRDISEQLQLEQRLAQSEKLKSIGQLAAGIAHEINTPTQYVGDNTRFIKDAYDDFGKLLNRLMELASSDDTTIPREALAEALADSDVEYFQTEIPRAIEQSLEGIERVATIVRAMKEFSHPAQEKTAVDLNSAIKSTLTVATNEYKYVAEIDTNFDPELPLVSCLPGEFNQAILNMIVNAAHAIIDVLGESPAEKGLIEVSTKKLDHWAEIRISDSGCGMSEDVKNQIFDPFFTTKEVGKGTGQGLSIAHDVVVNKLDGRLSVESETGKGSCFTILLPLVDSTQAVESSG